MKKSLFLTLFVAICCSLVFADNYSSKFTRALANCSAYSENGSLNSDGMSVTSEKRILGIKDGKCVYQEKTTFKDGAITITCSFTKAQREELANITNAYEIVQQYSGEKIDTSGYSAVENNPVVKAWAKYLQDSSVCSVN